MKMSDKEFDQLFNAKLTDLEIEPSAELWGKIVPEIPGSKDRSGLMPMMSIAATLVVVLAAGLLFVPRAPKLELRGNYNPAEATAQITAPAQTPDEGTATTDDPYQGINTSAATPVNRSSLAGVNKRTGHNEVIEQVGPTSDGGGDLVQPVEPAHDMNVEAIAETPVPGNITHIESIKPNITSALPNSVNKEPNPAKAIAMNNPQGTKTPEVVKKKKIHSLGDLLNVVIAKVDKRDNKIVQFAGSNDEDDDDLLNVTGVNLGPIKVKKQN